MNLGVGPPGPGVEEISETSTFFGELFVRLTGFGILLVGIVVGAAYCLHVWKRPDSDPHKNRYNIVFVLLLMFTTGGGVANCHGHGSGLIASFASLTVFVILCVRWWKTKQKPQ